MEDDNDKKRIADGWFRTVGGRIPRNHAILYVIIGMAAFLSTNLPPLQETNDFSDIAIFENRGCVFVNLPRNNGDGHPKLSVPYLPTALTHVIMRRAFGEAIPEWWHPYDPDSFECSHLCESFWRGVYKEHPPEAASVLPSIHCVNPLHITVEHHAANARRARCSNTWEGGCECGEQPPCVHLTNEERQLMLDLLAEWRHIFRINPLVGQDLGEGFFMLTPADFPRHPTPGHVIEIPNSPELPMEEIPRQPTSFVFDEALSTPEPPRHEVINLTMEVDALVDPHWPPAEELDAEFASIVAAAHTFVAEIRDLEQPLPMAPVLATTPHLGTWLYDFMRAEDGEKEQ